MRQFIRGNVRFIIAFIAMAVALRLLFIRFFPAVVADSFVYGDIAKNWLQHGIFGLSGPEEISPTYIRLPGYPAFLAFIFSIFGMEHYRAVLVTQMLIDIGTCFIGADIALLAFGRRAAKISFVLATVCPFLANYAGAALTETLEVFFTALAFDFALRALQGDSMRVWAGCGVACGAAILLRPDGILLAFAFVLYLVWKIARPQPFEKSKRNIFARAAVIVALASLAPLVPWTWRNWHVFHAFQPLAPRYANEQGESVPMGFNRWVKTWIADYTSVEEIYWNVPGAEMDASKLPSRAFDTPQQRAQTEDLLRDYNTLLQVSPVLDQRFDAIASERIRAHPIRYYIGLPLLRIMDMWLRPRTEMMPSDSRWWEFNDEPKWSALAITLGVINLLYILCACAGGLRNRLASALGLMLLFIAMRTLFLGSLENPEPRYTLEMYPLVIVLTAAGMKKTKEVSPKGNQSCESGS